MDIKDFTTMIVENIVKEKDMVKVNAFNNEEEIIIDILVSNKDMGAVIGKDGKNVKALRTIIQAYAYLNNIKRIKVNVDSF